MDVFAQHDPAPKLMQKGLKAASYYSVQQTLEVIEAEWCAPHLSVMLEQRQSLDLHHQSLKVSSI
jgi:hypothetical protein